MRHQGEHFDAGLSRGNVLGFKGVNFSSKVLGMPRHQGEHFDAGLSRGNVLGFKGVNFSSKVLGMPRSPEKTN